LEAYEIPDKYINTEAHLNSQKTGFTAPVKLELKVRPLVWRQLAESVLEREAEETSLLKKQAPASLNQTAKIGRQSYSEVMSRPGAVPEDQQSSMASVRPRLPSTQGIEP
jgi:hypothetical protein